MKQYYKIAGLVVEMDTFGRTAEQAKPYLCPEATPDIILHTDWAVFRERNPHLPPEECEYLVTGNSFYRHLLEHNGLLLHSSALLADGQTYCFSGPCGAGKSTHAALWRSTFGEENILLLNDDKPALRLEDGIWYAYGTPWSGKTAQNQNLRAPLAGVCFLRHAPENTIHPLSGAKAVFALLEQTVRPSDTRLRADLLRLTEALVTKIPIWSMDCNISPEAAILSRRAMSGMQNT